MVRVGIIDHIPMFLAGVQQVLSQPSDLTVVSATQSLPELAIALNEQTIDVVLVDSAHPAGCATICKQVRSMSAYVHIIVVVDDDDDAELAGAVRAGARGYVRRDVEPAELVSAVRTVSTGASLISAVMTSRFLDEFASTARRSDGLTEGTSALSRREVDVLRLIAQGLNNKAIAASLYISENTVKNHVRSIHEKLQVHSRMEAVVQAVREGLLEVG